MPRQVHQHVNACIYNDANHMQWGTYRSQVSFVTDRLANCLQLYRRKCDLTVEGVGATINTRVKGSVTFTLRSTTTNFEMRIDALVLSSITSPTPAVKIDMNQWPYLRDIAYPLWMGGVWSSSSDPSCKGIIATLSTSLDRENHRLEELVSNFWKSQWFTICQRINVGRSSRPLRAEPQTAVISYTYPCDERQRY